MWRRLPARRARSLWNPTISAAPWLSIASRTASSSSAGSVSSTSTRLVRLSIRTPATTIATATTRAAAGSSHSAPVSSTSTSPTSTPIDVNASVRGIPLERRRLGRARLPEEEPGYGYVGDRREADHRDAETERIDRRALGQPPDRLVDDHPGPDQDQHALDRGREVLDLRVAEGMIRVGRLIGLAHRQEGDDRRHEVDRRVDRLGDDRYGAGDHARDELHRDQEQVRDDRNGGGALLAWRLRRWPDRARRRPRRGRDAVPGRHQPAPRRRLKTSVIKPRGRRSASSSTSRRTSSRAALPRWLIASFSAGSSSAMVRPW